METNTTPAVVSTSPTPATVVPGGFTLGLDLGDLRHHVCVLDGAGQIVRVESAGRAGTGGNEKRPVRARGLHALVGRVTRPGAVNFAARQFWRYGVDRFSWCLILDHSLSGV